MRSILLFLFCFFSFIALQAQNTLQFSLNNGAVTFSYNGQPPASSSKITLTPGTGINIGVDIPGQNFNMSIGSAGTMKVFTQDDFSNGKTILIDSAMQLNGMSLKTNFQVSIDLSGQLFKQAFSIIRGATTAPGAGGGTVATSYQVGSIFYDALALAHPENITKEQWEAIVQHHFGYGAMDAASVKNNLFLRGRLANSKLRVSDARSGTAKPQSAGFLNPGSILADIGGLNVTTLADGLAKFLVQRTKEELNVAFFTKLEDEINKYPDLKTLFPNTLNLLDAIGEDVYDYERYIQNLREAFREDLDALAENLPGIIQNHPAYFTAHPDMEVLLRSASYITNALEEGVHPGDILADYPADFLNNLRNPDVKGAMQTLQLISYSLRDTTQGSNASYWVTSEQVRKMVRDTAALHIYLGLVYQHAISDYDSIHFNNTTLVQVMNQMYMDYQKGLATYVAYKTFIVGFSQRVDALDDMVKAYADAGSDSAAFVKYATYFNKSIDLLEYATAVGNLPYISKTKLNQLPQIMAPYFDVANSLADMVIDLRSKKYPAAINKALHIYQVVCTLPDQHAADSLTAKIVVHNKKAPAKPSEADSSGTNQRKAKNDLKKTLEKELARVQKIIDSSQEVLQKLAKYGSFMSAMANAKTSDEVNATIQTFALPSGSARIKRESAANVALNAYVGGFAGYEHNKGVDKGGLKFNAYGVTAPVGISMSLGDLRCRSKAGGKSLSLFLSVIDIGALTSFRFENDSLNEIPEIKLQDIISPGAFLSYGFGKTPLSLNVGYQSGPLLRKVSPIYNTVNQGYYGRWSISLVVDIPVLNFYTNSNKRSACSWHCRKK